VIRFFENLATNHGWHFVMELAALALVTVFTAFYLVHLFRGRVRAVVCPSCGRVASRAHAVCPRCRQPLEASP
jgi:predicted amidophosphoribosyltransferase